MPILSATLLPGYFLPSVKLVMGINADRQKTVLRKFHLEYESHL